MFKEMFISERSQLEKLTAKLSSLEYDIKDAIKSKDAKNLSQLKKMKANLEKSISALNEEELNEIRGNFNLSPDISLDDYGKAIDSYRNNTLINMAKLGKKFKAEGQPETMKVSGYASEGFQQEYYVSKDKKNKIKLTYTSSREGWKMVMMLGIFQSGGEYSHSSYSVEISDLSQTQIDSALQKIADKFPAWEVSDPSKFDSKAEYFPMKFKAAFNKRIPKD